MSTGDRCLSGVLSLVLVACAGEDGDDDGANDTSTGAPTSTTASTTATTSGTASTTTTAGEESTGSESEGSGEGGMVEGSSSSSDEGGASESEGSSSESGGAVVYDEEFVWVADFLRTNCVACHSMGMNGNLLLPSADITNDEVRAALEGVVATTGLLMVEPGDRNASQTWLQITNEFGAQFPVEDTDRFGAWIDAGAHYVVE